MPEYAVPTWFSQPQATKEAAQEAHQWQLFEPTGVFYRPDTEDYVTARLRHSGIDETEKISEIKKRIEQITGYQLVSYCDMIVPIWKDTPDSQE